MIVEIPAFLGHGPHLCCGSLRPHPVHERREGPYLILRCERGDLEISLYVPEWDTDPFDAPLA